MRTLRRWSMQSIIRQGDHPASASTDTLLYSIFQISAVVDDAQLNDGTVHELETELCVRQKGPHAEQTHQLFYEISFCWNPEHKGARVPSFLYCSPLHIPCSFFTAASRVAVYHNIYASNHPTQVTTRFWLAARKNCQANYAFPKHLGRALAGPVWGKPPSATLALRTCAWVLVSSTLRAPFQLSF